MEELVAANRSDWNALLNVTDLLLDGPYKQELPERVRPWVGSSNQRFHFLTERYRHLTEKLSHIPNGVEIRVYPNGCVSVNGMANSAKLQQILY